MGRGRVGSLWIRVWLGVWLGLRTVVGPFKVWLGVWLGFRPVFGIARVWLESWAWVWPGLGARVRLGSARSGVGERRVQLMLPQEESVSCMKPSILSAAALLFESATLLE